MLYRVDRIQMTARNALETGERWTELLDASYVHSDRVDALAGRRVTVQVGDSLVEILEERSGVPVLGAAGSGCHHAGHGRVAGPSRSPRDSGAGDG